MQFIRTIIAVIILIAAFLYASGEDYKEEQRIHNARGAQHDK